MASCRREEGKHDKIWKRDPGTDLGTMTSRFPEHLEEARGEVAFEKGIHNSKPCVTVAACNLWLQGVAGGR